MRVRSRAELELYLHNAEQDALDRAATLLRDHGATDDEVEKQLIEERAEWSRTRERILSAFDRVKIDAAAAEHEIQ